MWNPNEKMSKENYEKISTRIAIHEIKKMEESGKKIHYRYTEKENYVILDNRGLEDEYWFLSIEFDTWADFGLALEELESTYPLWHFDLESGYQPYTPDWDDLLDIGFPYTIARSENGPITINFHWENYASVRWRSERKEMEAAQIAHMESLEDI